MRLTEATFGSGSSSFRRSAEPNTSVSHRALLCAAHQEQQFQNLTRGYVERNVPNDFELLRRNGERSQVDVEGVSVDDLDPRVLGRLETSGPGEAARAAP